MNGQVPPGYEEIKKTTPRIPSAPLGYENIPEGYEEVSKLTFRPRMEPADWKKEFLPEFGRVTAEHIKGEIGKAPQMLTSKFWKKTYGNVKRTVQDIMELAGLATTPEVLEIVKARMEGRSLKSVMEPEKAPRPVKDIIKGGLQKGKEFITWLPEMGYKFVRSPVDTIRDDPVGTAFLFMAAAPGVRSLVKTKVKAGKPVTIHEMIENIPDNIIGKGAKRAVLEGIAPEYAFDLARLTTQPMPKMPMPKRAKMTTKDRLRMAKERGLVEEAPVGTPFERAQRLKRERATELERVEAFKAEELPPSGRPQVSDLKREIDAGTMPIKELYSGYPFSKEFQGRLRRLNAAEAGAVLKAATGKIPVTPEQKIISALKPAKVIRKQQEALYTEVRGERFPKALGALEKVRGRKGFEAARAELKGAMKKVEFEPIVQNLTQADVESLFNKIIDSRAVVGIDKVSAAEGLTKLLGEKGGVIPTASELALLNKVFPKDLVPTILSKRATWDKVKAGLLEGTNVPRALMASFDLSFGGRQGIFLAARYPKEFTRAFFEQFKLVGSDKAFRAAHESIVNRPTYKLMKRGGGQKELALTEMDAALSLREEAFMGAALAEKIPLVGKGVRASNRAYTGMANRLRADVFDKLVKLSEKAGRNPWKDTGLVDSIIDFVNAGSGRGALPKALEKSAVALNTVLFSPRLMSSRLSLLNPKFYIKLDPFVRKEALKSLFAFTGMTTTVLGLAKAAGAKVGMNPLSADWGKITIGDTRIDIMGGFQQYIRTAAQAIMGQTISTTTGKVTKTGEGYKPISRGQILGRGLEYKLAPTASFAMGLYRGRSIFGGEFDIPKEIANRFIPMVIQDMADLQKEDPELLPLAGLGFFGVGLQTYKQRKKKGVVY